MRRLAEEGRGRQEKSKYRTTVLVVCSVKEKVHAETAVPKPERSRRDRGGKKSRREPKKRARKSELAEKKGKEK